ncbi:hypothetical protein B296_00051045 [Ensete ventricosum]|uniref:Uncharacterized protein n=1 Tax=Ensete ventricosum TaxID=4639 RepID=A0A426XB51_ENSVE|nr:hypothetical protein B296_00051045 [Ensete ventricosum]
MPRVSGGKFPATRSPASTQEPDEGPPTEALRPSSKRSSDASVQLDDPARRHKKGEDLIKEAQIPPWQKGSRSHSKGKEPTMSIEEPEGQAESPDELGRRSSFMALFDRVYDAGRLITFMDYRINNLLQEIDALKAGGSPEAVAVAKERVTKLERELARTQQERTEALQRLETFDKELNEVRGDLSEARKQLKEARVRAWKVDDDLLKSMKDLESARAELPKQAIDDYKGSTNFEEGLKRMGRVAYEYGYWVALARFRSSHLDSKVEEDPFTIRPEDDSVPMERQQAFDNSNPPES